MASPEATSPTTTPVLEAPAAIPAVQATANPAPAAGADNAALQSQLDALLKWKASAEADLQKGRAAKTAAEERAAADQAAAMAKALEAGDFAKLHATEKDARIALEARLAAALPMAERLSAHEKRVLAKLEAAKKDGTLPSFITRSIDIAAMRDVDEALDILDEYRASLATAPAAPAAKQAAPPAPGTGAAPASPAVKKDVNSMTPAEIINLKSTDPKAHAEAFSGAPNGRPAFSIGKWLGG